MSARAVLLTAAEAAERERMAHECASDTAMRQYLAELIVLRELLLAAKAHSYRRIERTLVRLNRPSLALERNAATAGDMHDAGPPPERGSSERLL